MVDIDLPTLEHTGPEFLEFQVDGNPALVRIENIAAVWRDGSKGDQEYTAIQMRNTDSREGQGILVVEESSADVVAAIQKATSPWVITVASPELPEVCGYCSNPRSMSAAEARCGFPSHHRSEKADGA